MRSPIEDKNKAVTAVISHLVKPKCRQAYEDWINGISAIAAEFEGHRSVSIIRPEYHIYPEYVVILTFDSYPNLKRWMESEVRDRWIEKVKPLIQQPENVQVQTGLESWFTLPGQHRQKQPTRYKQAILTWVAVYALLMILNQLLAPFTEDLPDFLSTAITSGIVVGLLTYVVMPRVTQVFQKWLYPSKY